jgi:hypothetical protein
MAGFNADDMLAILKLSGRPMAHKPRAFKMFQWTSSLISSVSTQLGREASRSSAMFRKNFAPNRSTASAAGSEPGASATILWILRQKSFLLKLSMVPLVMTLRCLMKRVPFETLSLRAESSRHRLQRLGASAR